MKKSCIIQARMGSSRFPGKVLKYLKDKTVLDHIVCRLKICQFLDEVIIATTIKPEDDAIIDFCIINKIKYFRGSVNDVLERFVMTAREFECDLILRVTADDLFIDPKNIDIMINQNRRKKSDVTYTENMPLGCGLGMIVTTRKILENALANTSPNHQRYREHIDEYMLDNPKLFKINVIPAPENLCRPNYRLTLDTPEDWKLISIIFNNLYTGQPVGLNEVIKFLDTNQDLIMINKEIKQK